MSSSQPLAFPRLVTLQQIIDAFAASGVTITPHVIRRSAVLGRFPTPLLLGDRMELWREDEVLRAVTGHEPPSPQNMPPDEEPEPIQMGDDADTAQADTAAAEA